MGVWDSFPGWAWLLIPVKGTFNTSEYEDILDNFMLPTLWEGFEDGPFLVRKDEGWEELDWPPRSPDLNQTEPTWDELKQRLRTRPPHPTSVSDLTNGLLEG